MPDDLWKAFDHLVAATNEEGRVDPAACVYRIRHVAPDGRELEIAVVATPRGYRSVDFLAPPGGGHA
jgi:hypothetical protein